MRGNSTCKLRNRFYVAVKLRQTLSCLRRNFERRSQDVNRDKRRFFSSFIWKAGGPDASEMAGLNLRLNYYATSELKATF